MYLYFDRNGTLKEQITIPVRTGDENGEVNSIYVYWDTDKTIKLGTCCKFRMANGEYYISGGSPIIPATKLVDELQIPYDQNRDLKFFKYNTTYPFIKFTIPADVLATENENNDIVPVVNSVLFSSYILYENENQQDEVKALTMVAFAVEPTLLSVAQDQNINIAQWYELLREIQKAIEMVENGVTTNTDQLITGIKTFKDEINLTHKNTNDNTELYHIVPDGQSDVDLEIYIALPDESGTILTYEQMQTYLFSYVNLSGTQTITGTKTFKDYIKLTHQNTEGYIEGYTIEANDGFDDDANITLKLPFSGGTLATEQKASTLISNALTPSIMQATSAEYIVNQREGGETSVLITGGEGSHTVDVIEGYDIVATVDSGSITNIDQETGEISIISGAQTVTLSWHYEATRYAFKFNIGSDYNGLYVFTFYYLTMLVAIYALTNNQIYKFAGPGIQDFETGSVTTIIYNMKRVGNDLYIWSGKTEYQLIADLVGTLAKVKLY